MTIGEIVKETVDALPKSKQRQALSYIRRLGKKDQRSIKKPTAKSHTKKTEPEAYIPKHPAVRAIVGMWKDRTDLPKDGAEASKVLRRRMMGAKAKASPFTTADRNSQATVKELDAAMSDAAGIWKERTDLPKNSVAASRMLRRRLMQRGRNA